MRAPAANQVRKAREQRGKSRSEAAMKLIFSSKVENICKIEQAGRHQQAILKQVGDNNSWNISSPPQPVGSR